jgi:transposase
VLRGDVKSPWRARPQQLIVPEMLAYFPSRVTNARTEGFNGKAKLVIRRAYGYESFRNYRLRLLHACA